jgi:DUF4097 and DUF4098 domain-containing protein YvlB
MSKTAKVVIVFSSIALVCLIGVGIVLGVFFNQKCDLARFSNILGNATEVDESAQLSLDDIAALDVECTSGRIVFVESDEPRVTLKGKVWTSTPQDSYLTVSNEGNKVRVVFKKTRQQFLSWFHSDIEMTIYLPKENMLDLDVKNTSGSIEMNDMQFGDLAVHSTSGSGTISGIKAGTVDYKLTSGNTIIQSCVFDSMTIGCSSGTVKVYDTVADTKVTCTSGGILLDGIEGAVDARATSGNVTINMANVDIEPITVRITSGNCKLGVYEESAFNLSANVTSGNINLTMPIEITGKQDKDEVTGTRNGGGVLVDLKSTSGNITISTID